MSWLARFPLRPTITRSLLALCALFLISLAVRAYPAITLHFDGLYGQDAFAYYGYGQELRAAIPRLQIPGPWYWPLGYPAFVALGFVFTGEQALGPQITSLVSGAAVSIFALLLTIEIARSAGRSRRFAWTAGLVAWALVTVCGQLIQSSFVVMADAPALMWATMSAWALAVYARTRKPGWIALSAFALAWATMTRWQYGTLALPWALYTIINRPFRWRHAALAVVVGLITLSPQIVQSVRNPDPLLDHEWLQGWSVQNYGKSDFVTADGTFHYDQGPAWYYAQPLYNVYYMSAVMLPFLALGLLILRRASAVLLIGWVVVQYGFLAGIPYENIRFALALVPPVAVVVGLGAARVIGWGRNPHPLPPSLRSGEGELAGVLTHSDFVVSALSDKRSQNGTTLSSQSPLSMTWRGGQGVRIVASFLAILLIAYSLIATLKVSAPIFVGFVGAKNADLTAAQWIAAQIPDPNATVYCLDLLLMMQHYTALHPVQVYQLALGTLGGQLTTLAANKTPAYAVFNLWTTEHQWYGESPWQVYHYLKDAVGMTQIGTVGAYTLFRINPPTTP